VREEKNYEPFHVHWHVARLQRGVDPTLEKTVDYSEEMICE
jgi:hypothetical protein